jgi:hemerythrin-like metal-binding protein
MPQIQWMDSFKVNIRDIDAHHQRLINLINTLQKGIEHHEERVVMGMVIDLLIEYTKYHFSVEEGYFDLYHYPDAKSHKAQHQMFLSRVLQFKHDFTTDEMNLPSALTRFLSDWLQNHILVADHKFAPFLHAKGVK